jgi:MFS family permease
VSAIWTTFVPLYAARQGLSVLVIGEIFSVQGLTYALCQIPTGRLADRLGPERFIGPAVVGRAAATLIVPLLHAPAAFLLMACAYGVFGGIVPVSFTTVVARITPRERYTTAMGVYNSSGDLGFFVGPLVGGAAALLGIAAPFWLCAPLGVAAWLSAESAAKAFRPAAA